jgi:hypothetical protein
MAMLYICVVYLLTFSREINKDGVRWDRSGRHSKRKRRELALAAMFCSLNLVG